MLKSLGMRTQSSTKTMQERNHFGEISKGREFLGIDGMKLAEHEACWLSVVTKLISYIFGLHKRLLIF